MVIDHVNLSRVDLNLLVALDALLAERSVTRAAARVGLRQSAMSHNLARLRALFGDELLIRGADGMRATPRALALIDPVRIALAQITALVSRSFPGSTGSSFGSNGSSPSWQHRGRAAVVGDAGNVGVDHRGIGEDHRDQFVVLASGNNCPPSYPLNSENASPPGTCSAYLSCAAYDCE